MHKTYFDSMSFEQNKLKESNITPFQPGSLGLHYTPIQFLRDFDKSKKKMEQPTLFFLTRSLPRRAENY